VLEWLAAVPLLSWLDIGGSLLLLISLVLLIRKHLWYWHFGNLSLVPYFALFAASGQYMLAGLQVSYLIFGLHGLMLWMLENRRDARRVPFNERVWYNAGWTMALGIFAFTVTISDFSDGWTVLQFVSTSIALVANWATTRRWIWSWYAWLCVNALQAVLFFHLELWTQLAMQGILAALSVQGLLTWQKERSPQLV
jgi:nicotinamide mononucleotide transporter